MAKRKDKDLLDRLHAGGVRKKVASTVAEAAGQGRKASSKTTKTAQGALSSLASTVEEAQDRLRGGPAKRKASAKKAAATRKRKAKARSAAAKRGAKTRAKK